MILWKKIVFKMNPYKINTLFVQNEINQYSEQLSFCFCAIYICELYIRFNIF